MFRQAIQRKGNKDVAKVRADSFLPFPVIGRPFGWNKIATIILFLFQSIINDYWHCTETWKLF